MLLRETTGNYQETTRKSPKNALHPNFRVFGSERAYLVAPLRVLKTKAPLAIDNDSTGAPKKGNFRSRLVNGTVRVDTPKTLVHMRTDDNGLDGKWYLTKNKTAAASRVQ